MAFLVAFAASYLMLLGVKISLPPLLAVNQQLLQCHHHYTMTLLQLCGCICYHWLIVASNFSFFLCPLTHAVALTDHWQ